MVVEFQRGDWKVVEFSSGGRVLAGRLESGGVFEWRQGFSGGDWGIEVEFEAAANFWLR